MGESDQFIKRLEDMRTALEGRQCLQMTDFLTMAEQSDAIGFFGKSVNYRLWGGFPESERRRLFLLTGEAWEESVHLDEIACVAVTWSRGSGGSRLTHRDFLGALLGLGLDRRVLGDLVILEDRCLVFCLPHMADFILNSLFAVGSVHVSTESVSHEAVAVPEAKFKAISGTVASLRLDNIVKMCGRVSRSESLTLIKSGKVFINGRQVMSPGGKLAEGCLISIRGKGKFRLTTIGKTSKKDRIHIQIDAYI